MAGAGGPHDSSSPELMRQMAGVYYSFRVQAFPIVVGPKDGLPFVRMVRITQEVNQAIRPVRERVIAGSGKSTIGSGHLRVRGTINQGILTTIGSSGKPTDIAMNDAEAIARSFGNTKFRHCWASQEYRDIWYTLVPF